jgi:signal recognition particle subunit SRP54
MFESLTDKLIQTLRTVSGKSRLTEEVLDEACRQLRTNLLDADVNVKVVKDFVQAVREKAMATEVQKSLTPEQHFIRIVYEELRQIMGSKAAELNLRVRPPAVFLMVGLQGSGKTTSSVKLAKHLRDKEKKRVLLASVDIYRPAAIEQLRVQAETQQLETFESPVVDSVRARAMLAKETAIRQNAEILIIDTAGRLHVDEAMMEELQDLNSFFGPAEVLLVLDGMTGQDAVQIAGQFQERLPLSGAILTKLDGDSRGGAALSVRAVTGCPIKFIGVGEKPQDLDVFHPDRMASRILDMGDLLSLAEKAKSTLDPAESLKLAKKVKKNEFTLGDFYLHLQQIKKMGSFENLLKFLPGMGQMAKQIRQMPPPDAELKKIEAIILSMTPSERADHNVLDGSRRKRIARGSGTEVQDVNRLVKQFLEARRVMSKMSKLPMGKRGGLW